MLKQGKGTADHLLPLGDWFDFFFHIIHFVSALARLSRRQSIALVSLCSPTIDPLCIHSPFYPRLVTEGWGAEPGHPSIPSPIHPSIHLGIHPSIHPSIHLPTAINPSIHPCQFSESFQYNGRDNISLRINDNRYHSTDK